MSGGRVRIGIGGWTYAPWRGLFYPDDLPHAKELDYAARALSTIEINATFYRRQSPASWEKWGKTVRDEFQFAIKASRYCVMAPQLAQAKERLDGFFEQGFTALGPKLGPILWQFAARRTFDREDIAGFLDLLPTERDGVQFRHAIEPRNESFRDDAFLALCRERNVAVVLEDSEDYPTIEADTADFSYARLQRMREELATGYDDAALDGFAARAEGWRKARRDAYVYFINGAKLRAPAAALALQERLR